jgi:hypothetical protein
MKVALVKPCWDYPITAKDMTYNRIWFPLDLAVAASMLRDRGHEPVAVDGQAERLHPRELVERVRGADLVFVSSGTLDRWQCPNVDIQPFLAACDALREAKVPFFVMGYHGTVRPAEILERTGAVASVMSEPEATIVDLADRRSVADGGPAADGSSSDGMDLDGVPGVAFLKDGSLVRNDPRPFLDMEAFPVPAYDLFDLDRYFYELLGDRFLLFESMRGCPFPCTFCAKDPMYGVKVRKRHMDKMLRDIEEAVTRHGVKTGYVFDLEFTLKREPVIDFCRKLAAKNLDFRWCCQTRCDQVDPELLSEMKRAGCRLIHVGVESGNERVSKFTDKRITLDQIRDGIRMIKESGMEVLGFFMMGLPTESEEEMADTIRFAKEANPTYASFHFAVPYIGTRLHDEYGGVAEDVFPVICRTDRSLEEMNRRVKAALKEFYLRPGYVADRVRRAKPKSLVRQGKLFLDYMRQSNS